MIVVEMVGAGTRLCVKNSGVGQTFQEMKQNWPRRRIGKFIHGCTTSWIVVIILEGFIPAVSLSPTSSRSAVII
jgi:hypothetical protein